MNAESNSVKNGGLILEDEDGAIAEFVLLEVDNTFAILTVTPPTIRRKDNHKEIRVSDLLKYERHFIMHVVLNEKMYLKDQIINKQFYKNSLNKNKTTKIHKYIMIKLNHYFYLFIIGFSA